MDPRHPRMSSHAGEADPSRLFRLARLDGRVRELMRILTPEGELGTSSLGERVWAGHVLALHDERGMLMTSVSQTLVDSPWLTVVATVLARAWEGEDEADVIFVLPDGRHLPLEAAIRPPEGTELPQRTDWLPVTAMSGRGCGI